jgi:hypothetical protein
MCHEDIHHQSSIKVLYVLKALYYWPGMSAQVEKLCTACQTCLTASVRRRHLKTKFDAHAPQSTAMPRQDYGIDFYGVYKGEIMVIVDLFTRETILTHLNNRTQDGIALTILKHIIFQRGVPRTPCLPVCSQHYVQFCDRMQPPLSRLATAWRQPRSPKHVWKPLEIQPPQKGEETETHWKTLTNSSIKASSKIKWNSLCAWPKSPEPLQNGIEE